MKKNGFLVFVAVIAVLALALSAFSSYSIMKFQDREVELGKQVEELQAQIQQLQGELERQQMQKNGLSDWSLTAVAWEDYAGADVKLTMVPEVYREGLGASLAVYYQGETVANIPCTWDGTSFTATAVLHAFNGYSYSCVLTESGNLLREISLTSMEEPTLPQLVFLADALDSYCNLSLGEWTVKDGKLEVDPCYVQVQLPQLTMPGSVYTWEQAWLILKLDDGQLQRIPLSLNPGEGSNSYELELRDVVFEMPDMTEDSQLDLVLEVELTGGKILTSYGASWYMEDDQLLLAAG